MQLIKSAIFTYNLHLNYACELDWEPITEPQSVTCHMGSHSVTCHPTQVNVPTLTPAMKAGTRFTYPGGMEG